MSTVPHIAAGRDGDVFKVVVTAQSAGFYRPRPEPNRAVLQALGTRPERTLFVHSQRIDHPEKWRKSAVMTDRWRLINGAELYDMAADPGKGAAEPPPS